MGHIVKTDAGSWRANWRDPSGRQRAKTFPTKRDASRFLAEVETTRNRGLYVDPHAGRVKLGDYLPTWLAGRHDEITTAARDRSILRTHVVPRWGTVALAKIDHSSVQAWVAELSTRRSAATVRECCRLLSSVLRSAVRDRIIAFNPAEGVRMPKRRRKDTDERTISREAFLHKLLPVIPDRYAALVAVAGGTGLRWGECVGLRWDAIELTARQVHVVRVAVEVAGTVTGKPFPKSRAGRRVVPLPAFVVEALRHHQATYAPGPAGEVFTNEVGGPPRRTLFRARVWRPSLVRAGLLGDVAQVAIDQFEATWRDDAGHEHRATFAKEQHAVNEVARRCSGGLRFHDLRHSYATWLVSDGVPVNDVQRVMGHERPSTTLDLYTHARLGFDQRLTDAFADFPLTPADESDPGETEEPSEEGS
ncbi:tyrosine-type recombinase/integrase [Jiangella rhizosphaerae]|uniref:Site-specific integrase n=1 Tax=Jiangella rhizosphaerae TaxID=2293569 RepID=A0A418KP37_9ACTN|nr:site-specific integrase [Jiangella rhizosphaerae]RIQ21047.1 site-specific integrase [Jiangella rhizosphaerae]